MQKIDCTGNAGLSGWTLSRDELISYQDEMIGAWRWWNEVWEWLRPSQPYKIAYTNFDGSVSIVVPSIHFLAILQRGGIVRHMRVIDSMGQQPCGYPVFEGTGERLPSMSQKEAMEFVAWKDIPRGINHIAVIDGDSLPKSRERRDSWRLSDDGRVVEA